MKASNIASSIVKSNYFIAASGCRDVGFDELTQIIKIIRSNKPETIHEKLKNLYKYHPDTIALDRCCRESDCDSYDEYNCDCFMPDVKYDDCFCSRERKEKLLNSDYRNTKEYSTWRTSVFERDNYTCQDCGITGSELNAHHLKTFKNYPNLRYNKTNGITLCVECHRNRHRKNNVS